MACFFIWPITHKLGRKYSIAICSLVFIVGALIQTVNTHSTTAFYVARVIAGLGLGGSSVVVPMFSSEMTPKQIRGQVGSFYQLMYTLGTIPTLRTTVGSGCHAESLQASSPPTGWTGVWLEITLASHRHPSSGRFRWECRCFGPVSWVSASSR